MYSQQAATKTDEYRFYINMLFQDFLEYYLLINIYVSQEVFVYVQAFRQVFCMRLSGMLHANTCLTLFDLIIIKHPYNEQ
jgi:hypothetical protein